MIALPPSRYGAAAPEVRYGPGVSAQLPSWCVGRVGLVSDPGVVAAGLTRPVEAALAARGAEVTLWAEVRPNPTGEQVARAADALRGVELLVAVGGGSALDTAKAVALLHAAGGRIEDHAGPRGGPLAAAPIVAVPTTAGTGSEMQSFTLMSRPDGVKVACGHPALRPRLVLLDPELTRSCPARVAAEAWLDAVVHAIETSVCTVATDASRAASVAAARELAHGDPLLGAALAGAAIEASMLGAAHAIGNALTARHHLPHGVAVGLMAPHVLRMNQGYADVAPVAGAVGVSPEDLPAWLTDALVARGVAPALGAHGVQPGDAPALAEAAMAQWTGRFNPRPLDAELVAATLRAAI